MDDKQIALLMQQMTGAMKQLVVCQMAGQIAAGIVSTVGDDDEPNLEVVTLNAVGLAEMIYARVHRSEVAPKPRKARRG